MFICLRGRKRYSFFFPFFLSFFFSFFFFCRVWKRQKKEKKRKIQNSTATTISYLFAFPKANLQSVSSNFYESLDNFLLLLKIKWNERTQVHVVELSSCSRSPKRKTNLRSCRSFGARASNYPSRIHGSTSTDLPTRRIRIGKSANPAARLVTPPRKRLTGSANIRIASYGKIEPVRRRTCCRVCEIERSIRPRKRRWNLACGVIKHWPITSHN